MEKVSPERVWKRFPMTDCGKGFTLTDCGRSFFSQTVGEVSVRQTDLQCLCTVCQFSLCSEYLDRPRPVGLRFGQCVVLGYVNRDVDIWWTAGLHRTVRAVMESMVDGHWAVCEGQGVHHLLTIFFHHS